MSRFQLKVATLVLLAVAVGCSADDAVSTSTSARLSPATASTSAPISTTVPIATTVATTTVATTAATTTAATTTLPETAAALWDTWTLIYASLDAETHQRAAAEEIAISIDAGDVLRSDDYPSLNPGYWVVVAGQWGNRRAAALNCPAELDSSLSCYPRYLGDRPSRLLAAGAAVAQLDQKLVVLDPTSGEVLATLSDDFHNEGEFPRIVHAQPRGVGAVLRAWV